MPEARLAELEAPALESRAATAQALAKALGEYGDTKVLYKMHLSHSETPRFGKPVLLFHVSAPPASDQAPPTAYVIRYVFREVTP